jgi:hypothetical protein
MASPPVVALIAFQPATAARKQWHCLLQLHFQTPFNLQLLPWPCRLVLLSLPSYLHLLPLPLHLHLLTLPFHLPSHLRLLLLPLHLHLLPTCTCCHYLSICTCCTTCPSCHCLCSCTLSHRLSTCHCHMLHLMLLACFSRGEQSLCTVCFPLLQPHTGMQHPLRSSTPSMPGPSCDLHDTCIMKKNLP